MKLAPKVEVTITIAFINGSNLMKLFPEVKTNTSSITGCTTFFVGKKRTVKNSAIKHVFLL